MWGRREHVAEVASPGRVVLLDLEDPSPGPLVLEGSAAVIWDSVESGSTVSQVAEDVAGHFGVPVTEVEGAVRDFIADMAGRKLLVRHPSHD